MDNNISKHDRDIIRNLARQVAEIASDPIMEIRRLQWKKHNNLHSLRPMMLIFPEGAWEEIIPVTELICQTDETRVIELNLRQTIHTYHHFQDDTVVENEWVVGAVIRNSGWGLTPDRKYSSQSRGAWAFKPILEDEHELNKMHYPDLIYDHHQTQNNLEIMENLLGDVLTIRLAGVKHISYHLAQQYSEWCGLEQMMVDMAERPSFVHKVMSFLEEGHHKYLRQLLDANLLSLNNDNTYHSSGGNGYIDELPRAEFDGKQVKPGDMWASAESQEMAQVSPRMHSEFAMQYEKRLLQPFGLTGYGCCEDLSKKLADVFTIPNIRRISIAPSANVDICAKKINCQYIFSWKPQPAHLVGFFDERIIRGYIQHTLAVCKENGCILEMILKDTHTCESRPELFDRWTQIAREEIEASCTDETY
jgi:hypothetical protein